MNLVIDMLFNVCWRKMKNIKWFASQKLNLLPVSLHELQNNFDMFLICLSPKSDQNAIRYALLPTIYLSIKCIGCYGHYTSALT